MPIEITLIFYMCGVPFVVCLVAITGLVIEARIETRNRAKTLFTEYVKEDKKRRSKITDSIDKKASIHVFDKVKKGLVSGACVSQVQYVGRDKLSYKGQRVLECNGIESEIVSQYVRDKRA